ncbi:MAG: winged helix-turn-helix transcriptional regulator, partial [Promethearchaeota archaeon]
VTELKIKFTMDGYNELSRKWAINILKSMFLGCKRFSDFLETHEGLSNRVLSDQLKRLEHHGFIEKMIVTTTPVKIEYCLTEIGRDLNKMLYEKCMFAIRQGLIDRNDPYFRGKNLEEAFGIKK